MKRVLGVLAALSALAGCGESEYAEQQGEPGLSSAQAALASVRMDCYIDTPAFDRYTSHYCSTSGSSPTVAVFRLVTPTPAAQVTWWSSLGDHPECADSTECAVPISPEQSITMGAFWITYQGTPTQGAGATAEYIGNY